MDEANDVCLDGRFTRLRPLTAQFADQLHWLAMTNRIPWQWHGPRTPEGFQTSLWQGVLVQFAVEELRAGRPVALVRADNANLFQGHAYLTVMLHPDFRMRAWPLEGAALFGDYLFRKFNLQRIYAETAGPYFDQFKSGAGKLFDVEARFRNRVLVDSRREDLYILTFTRERWLEEGMSMIQRRKERHVVR